jgi:Bacterial mobilisation protein (MobC).
MARPKKAPEELRTERLSGIRLTSAERHYVELLAERAGLDVAEFCRRAILGQRILARRSDVNERTLAELNRIGVNLNQIAHAGNSGRGLPAITAAVLDELRAAIAKVLANGS